MKKLARSITVLTLVISAVIAMKNRRAVPTRKKRSQAGGTIVPSTPSQTTYSQEDIALRAYYLSEQRKARGLANDPYQDWIDAEQEFTSARV